MARLKQFVGNSRRIVCVWPFCGVGASRVKEFVYNADWTRQPEKPYLINQFHATCLFLCTLKTSENQKFSDVFEGYRKRLAAWNRLSTLKNNKLRNGTTRIIFVEHVKPALNILALSMSHGLLPSTFVFSRSKKYYILQKLWQRFSDKVMLITLTL